MVVQSTDTAVVGGISFLFADFQRKVKKDKKKWKKNYSREI
jgi:hypothetical protein